MQMVVQADRSLLSRAVANVLRNARHHGGDACVVKITALSLPSGGVVELRIADDGPGVAEGGLERLFEPFTVRMRRGPARRVERAWGLRSCGPGWRPAAAR